MVFVVVPFIDGGIDYFIMYSFLIVNLRECDVSNYTPSF